MCIAVAETFKEIVEFSVILGGGVLVFLKPGPKLIPDAVPVVAADVIEVISHPALDILSNPETTVQVKPLLARSAPKGEVRARPGLPRLGGLFRHEVYEPLSPASLVQGLGLKFKFCWPSVELQVSSQYLKAEPLR